MAFTAFVTDAFSRRIVGWHTAGSQYTSIRYANRLLDAGALASIGSVGDSYDTQSSWRWVASVTELGQAVELNAMAESTIGLYKTECTHREGPWRSVDDLELATPGLGRLVEHQPAALGHRLRPTSRVRGREHYRHNHPAQHPLPGELSLH